MTSIEYIKQQHLPQLATLYDLLSQPAPDIEAMAKVFKAMDANKAYHLLGAWEDDTLAGTIKGIVCLDMKLHCRPFMLMENLVVLESHQGKGIGKALLQKLEQIAVAENCLYLQFCSASHRKNAHTFYETMGYEKDFVKGYRKFF
jgi:GNAT superfamily N-acetyltransferase